MLYIYIYGSWAAHGPLGRVSGRLRTPATPHQEQGARREVWHARIKNYVWTNQHICQTTNLLNRWCYFFFIIHTFVFNSSDLKFRGPTCQSMFIPAMCTYIHALSTDVMECVGFSQDVARQCFLEWWLITWKIHQFDITNTKNSPTIKLLN